MFLIVFIVFIIVLYVYNVRTFHYWKKRGVKYAEPVIFFGTNKKVFLNQQSRTQYATELYFKYPNEKVVGAFRSSVPELIIRDPELIKNILVTDFTSFYLRGMNAHRKVFEPLRTHLFTAEGDLWRMLRKRLTPAFTSGKLKAMFPLIIDRIEKLQDLTLDAAVNKRTVNARNLMACFTTDVIGSCGFGIDTNSLNSELDSSFRKLGVKMLNLTTRDRVVNLLKEAFPELCKNMKSVTRFEKELFELVEQIKKGRNYKPIGRHDFIDLLLDYQGKGPMEAESLERVNKDGSPILVSKVLDDDIFAGQVLVFFAAGFETSSSATSYTLHQLAYHPEVQKKVHENIDEVLEKHNNILSYDSIREMTYLDWTLKETLRMFPSLGFLMRKSSRNYTFRDINLAIDENVVILIPIQGLHMDPKYWDQPEEFRPERYHPDNFTMKQKAVYFPYGDGPRNCIGSRLGQMQSIAGLAAILSKFTVEPAPESVYQPEVSTTIHVVQSFSNGLPLRFRRRKP